MPRDPVSFSIITVVYNGETLLPGTMQSVLDQTYLHIEYIVIDGASRDNTLQIIKGFAPKMPRLRWISEKDSGLYDAMNKGLQLATGDFVQFLNTGDHLHAPDTIEKLAALAKPNTGVLYGETLLVDEDRKPAGIMSELSTRKIPKHLHWRDFLGGMLVVHQSFIPRRTLAPLYRHENLCADYDWCIRILKSSPENVYTGLTITNYLMGGLSKQRHQQSLKDRFQVMQAHYGLLPTLFAHAWIICRAIGHRLLRLGKPKY